MTKQDTSSDAPLNRSHNSPSLRDDAMRRVSQDIRASVVTDRNPTRAALAAVSAGTLGEVGVYKELLRGPLLAE